MIKKLITKLGLLDTYINYKQGLMIKEHNLIANLWREKIDAFNKGNITPPNLTAKHPELVGKKIIWQYWGQGVKDYNELPELILACFESVDRNKEDYIIIRLDNNTIKEYLDFPEFVYQKISDESYSLTHFSDLLRIALLATYGGVWLDATIYLTGALPEYLSNSDYFMYQRSDDEPIWVRNYWKQSYYAYWSWNPCFKVRCLNSVIASKPRNRFISTLYTLLLDYWHTQPSINHYFTFQILANELTATFKSDELCPIVSDVLPHLLGMSIGGNKPYLKPSEVYAQTTIHKFNSKAPNLNQFIDYLWRQRTKY